MRLTARHLIFWHRRIAHAHGRTLEACLGIDQELAGDDNFLACLEAAADFGLSVGFDADLHVGRHKAAVSLRNHHDTAFAGLDHCLRRYQQHFSFRGGREVDRGEHARNQSTVGIGDLDAHLERTGSNSDLRQDGIHPALERGARKRGRARLYGIAGTYLRRDVFRNLGVDPDGAQPVDAEQHRSRHDRHAFARAEFRDDATDRRIHGQSRMDRAGGFDQLNLLLRHAGQSHTLSCTFLQSVQPVTQAAGDDAFGREILFLCRDPFGNVDFGQRLVLAHGVERRAHEKLFHETVAARLYECHVTLVVSNAANRLDHLRKISHGHVSRTHAQVLLYSRTDLDGAFVAAITGIYRD